MVTYPQLAYKDRYIRRLSQIEGDTDCSVPFAFLLQDTPNKIVNYWTGTEFTRILSALKIGADLCFSESANQILWDFVKAVQCPPPMSVCEDFPTYASFMSYSPMNPYTNPAQVPDGYIIPPMVVVTEENIGDYPDNQLYDILVPFNSFPLDTGWLDDLDGKMPSVLIRCEGEGELEIRLLTVPQGGLVIVTVDDPPNLVDILAGIITGADNIVDVNRDILSVPPETAKEIIYPVKIEGEGTHTVYVVFFPIIDDSLVPVRFGGGFRGVELCGFTEYPDMGITALRFLDCNLETLNSGEWSVVDGWENWLDCVPSGTGEGVAAVKATNYGFEISGGNQDTTSTTMVQAAGTVQSHQFTYPHALIFAEAQVLNTNAASNIFCEVRVGSTQSSPNAVQRLGGNAPEVLYISGSFSGLDTINPSNINLYFRANANTARIATGARIVYTILEYADSSDLEAMFVQDIQYTGGKLQKKLDGVWFDVVDIAALLAPVSAAAAAAQTAANNAQSTANGAVSVNNAQNTRLNTAELDIDVLQADSIAYDSRLDTLEALGLVQQEFWYKEWDLLSSANGWTSPTASWSSGQGFVMNGAARIQYSGVTLFDNRVTHAKFDVRRENGGFGTMTIEYANSDGFAVVRMSGSGLLTNQWFKVPNNDAQPTILDFLFSNFDGNVRLQKIKVLGRGTNLF